MSTTGHLPWSGARGQVLETICVAGAAGASTVKISSRSHCHLFLVFAAGAFTKPKSQPSDMPVGVLLWYDVSETSTHEPWSNSL